MQHSKITFLQFVRKKDNVMKKNYIGTTSANGWSFLSFKERFATYKKLGFHSIMLWWGEGEKETRKDRVDLAREYNLYIENVHTDMGQSNSMWEPGLFGDQKIQEHIQAVKDCATHGIRRMVVHLTNGDTPPGISDIGLKRIEMLIEYAIKYDVIIAIENVRTDTHIKHVLDNYKDKHVAFCYDTGHANLWCNETDWLSLYSDRLAAVHLHDNNGNEDEHSFPLSGTINWTATMQKLNKSTYDGCITLETEYRGSDNIKQLEKFLEASYQSGFDLAML
jgi:sugar phosphate isomerase/epimerase